MYWLIGLLLATNVGQALWHLVRESQYSRLWQRYRETINENMALNGEKLELQLKIMECDATISQRSNDLGVQIAESAD